MVNSQINDITIEANKQGIILDSNEGLTEIYPSVIMFYGVSRNCMMKWGQARQRRYIALFNKDHYRIELL